MPRVPRLSLVECCQVLAPRMLTRASVVMAAALLLLAGCSGDDAGEAVEPEGGPISSPTEEELAQIAEDAAAVATIAVPEGFVVPDTRSAQLPVLAPGDNAQEPDQSVPISGGESTLAIDVVGPGGHPVPGATVLVERFANGGVGTRELGTNAAGRAGLSDILGGRYRVRAWAPPRLTATESQVTFMRDGDQERLRVEMEEFEGFTLEASLRASAWAVGQSAAFEVVVVEQAVGPDGIVRGVPVIAEVEVNLSAGLRMAGGTADTDDDDDDNGAPAATRTEVRTGGDGRAVWNLTCQRPGNHTVTVTAVEETVTVDLVPCGQAPDPDDDDDDDEEDDE